MKHLRSRLGRRLVVMTVAASSVLAFVITAVQLFVEYRRDRNDMSAHFTIIGQNYLPSIEETVWLLDRQRLDTLLDGIARLPDFRFAAVSDGDRVIASKGVSEPSLLVRQFELTHVYRGAPVRIGVLSVGASTAALNSRLWTRAGLVLAGNSLKTGLVALFMLLMIDAMVVRRLARIAGQVESYRDGAVWQPVSGHDTARTRRDEIGELGRALDAMAARVERSLAELHALNAGLESRVEARTRDLTLARDEAQRANQAKSEFLSSMSHELRTPLNAILGFAQLLKIDAKLGAAQRDHAAEILMAGRHLLELIDEVLDLARIESGQIDVKLGPIEVAPLLESCAALVGPQMAARQIALATALAPGLVVQADPTRLRQVLLNLLSNAIKYNRVGGSVRVGATAADDGSVRISVQDSGPGIPQHRLAELFQPFNRLGAEHNGIDGTGIGLVISERLVRMMGGRIGVETETGVGSTFSVVLPTAVAAPAAAGTVARAQRTLLVVDDNPADLRLTAQVIALRPGISLLTAGSVAEAAARVQGHAVDLVVVALDGLAPGALVRLRELPREAPLLGLAVDGGLAERRLADGEVQAVASKPLDVPRFLATVDRLLPA